METINTTRHKYDSSPVVINEVPAIRVEPETNEAMHSVSRLHEGREEPFKRKIEPVPADTER